MASQDSHSQQERRQALLETGFGMVLGLFTWLAYRQLSSLDPFASSGLTGILAALAGGLLYRSSLRPVVYAMAGSIALMFVLVAHTPIIRAPAAALIRADPIVPVDAIVVLSSLVSDDELLDRQGADRLIAGIELAHAARARTLVVTPIFVTRGGRKVSSHVDQSRLLKLAPDSLEIVYTGDVNNTHDEAVQTALIAKRRSWSRVAVVTSPLHSRRACAAFEKQGLDVVCVPAAARDVAVTALRQAPDRLRAFQLWLYESLATSEYRRRGWI